MGIKLFAQNKSHSTLYYMKVERGRKSLPRKKEKEERELWKTEQLGEEEEVKQPRSAKHVMRLSTWFSK